MNHTTGKIDLNSQLGRSTLLKLGYFLVLLGAVLSVFNFAKGNLTAFYSGFSFFAVSTLGIILVYSRLEYLTKLAWAFLIPFCVIVPSYIFGLYDTGNLISFGFALLGSTLCTCVLLEVKKNRLALVISLVINFFSLLFYDKIITLYNPFALDISFFYNNYLLIKFSQIAYWLSVVYFMLQIQYNNLQLKSQLLEKNKSLKKFNASLIELAKNKSLYHTNLEKAVEEILRFTASVLGINRVSLWEYNDSLKCIQSVREFDVKRERFCSDTRLFAQDYPIYFNTILKEKKIIADDALADPSTSEYTSNYLLPNNIKSMLDIPYYINGEFKGIFCCEQVEEEKHWAEEDVFFAQAISDYVCIVYNCYEHAEKSLVLQYQNEKLATINHEISNFENDSSVNSKWIEEELNRKQAQIEHYSFLNSHVLRSPVSTILGLIELLKNENYTEKERKRYLELLDEVSHRLDEAVRKINKVLQ